jgi:hypothetical protein
MITTTTMIPTMPKPVPAIATGTISASVTSSVSAYCPNTATTTHRLGTASRVTRS